MNGWIPISDKLPPPHTRFLALNRDGRHFDSQMCYGMHKPWFTYPHGYASASDTLPDWIDVTHWQPLPDAPSPAATEK